MKKWLFAFVAMVTAAGVGASASAQVAAVPDEQRVGTRFKQAAETVEAGRTRYMQKRVANCMYNRNRKDIDAVLDNSDFNHIDFKALSLDPKEAMGDWSMSNCISKAMNSREDQMWMQANYSTMRNLFAEEAYLRYADTPVALVDGAIEAMGDKRRYVHRQRDTIVLAELADCLTYRNLSAADAMLRGLPGSGTESEAFDALAPTLSVCLKSDEAEMSVPISMIRQVVADGLWTRYRHGDLAGS
ncbi:hypothetical protein WJT74_03590 [Sphingomicrobium sp. XHP0239]|uniref:hypothetical protein n=1 Tax=Sphingomicrobium maritimum TaxID=3133972 RepID=UPI0031CC7B19